MHLSPLPLPGVGAALRPLRLAHLQDRFVSPKSVFGQGFGSRWMMMQGSMFTPVLSLPRCVRGLRPVPYRSRLSPPWDRQPSPAVWWSCLKTEGQGKPTETKKPGTAVPGDVWAYPETSPSGPFSQHQLLLQTHFSPSPAVAHLPGALYHLQGLGDAGPVAGSAWCGEAQFPRE